jgi:microcin C transport system substrate-binding protein
MKTLKEKSLLIVLTLLLMISISMTLNAAGPKSQPVGDPKAVRGGQLILHTSEFPKSFNYFVNTSVDSHLVFGLTYDTLLEVHPLTLEFQPLIAKSWVISPDKKEFTFTIDPRAKWSDGKPITTADIKFTYDTIMNPKNLTSVQRMSLVRFNPPVVVNRNTIKFTAKTVHYNNLVTLATLNVLPKHLFSGKDFNKAFNMKLPPGSGPYYLSEVKEGRYYVLKRNPKYYADKFPNHRGMYNFETIKFKIMDPNVAFEAFKKGDFDIYDEVSSKRWVTETNTTPFRKNWIVKQKIYNYTPQGFSGLAFNMRKPLFQDIRVREAISHLLDRKYLLEKITYNQYQPLTSYWPSLYGTGKANDLINYDPAKAKQLLKEAGYDRLDKSGYLINSKNERLEFSVLYVGESFEKHLTYFAETCKQAGVKLNLQLLSWATLIKKMDNYDYDTAAFAWSATLFDDPEQLWHSKHIPEPGGSNITGYKNPAVDKLIESMPPIFDAAKRVEITKQIDRIIYREYPYVLFWYANYTKILYKNIFGMPKTVFSKYGGGGSASSEAIAYWWYDPAKVKRYQQARKKNQTLPKEPEEVYFDKKQP